MPMEFRGSINNSVFDLIICILVTCGDIDFITSLT